MRSILKTAINFGMISIPVKLYSATEDHGLKSHQVHAHDHGRIRYRKVCETCSEEVSSADIAKAFDTEDGQVILSDDLSSEGDKSIQVLEFITSPIDPLMLDKPYYLGLDGNSAAKAYALLFTILEGRTAIAKFTMRGRTHLAALSVSGELIVAHTLHWADEIRPARINDAQSAIVLAKRQELTTEEIQMAEQLVSSMTVEFDPSKYTDTAAEELRELVAAESTQAVAEVSDLLAKLERSAKSIVPMAAEQSVKPNIREWARANGYEVGNRGRIPAEIVERFEKEAVA